MLKLAICDDNIDFIDHLEKLIIEKIRKEVCIIKYSSCKDLLSGISDGRQMLPDILIMDICFNDSDGIETVKTIQCQNKSLKVIYLTGESKHSTRIFETTPSNFLTKPVEREALAKALNKAENELQKEFCNTVVLPYKNEGIRLMKNEITFSESSRRKLIVHIIDNKFEVYDKLDNLQKQLGSDFLRCHNSFLVNMSYIRVRNGFNFLLFTEETVPISKTRLKEVRTRFTEYLGRNI